MRLMRHMFSSEATRSSGVIPPAAGRAAGVSQSGRPTPRRSPGLNGVGCRAQPDRGLRLVVALQLEHLRCRGELPLAKPSMDARVRLFAEQKLAGPRDRESTPLNSSHPNTSSAV